MFHSPYDPLMEVFFFDQFLPKTITLLQFLPPFTKETNIHFLNVLFLMPKPPCFLLLLMISHLRRWYFFFCPPPCQKKDLLCLSNLSVLDLGRRYMDIWYTKELDRLESIRVALPAMDKDLPFQVANFFSFFSSRCIQSLTCNLPGLTGTPKYLIGKVPICQLNNSAYCILMLSSP